MDDWTARYEVVNDLFAIDAYLSSEQQFIEWNGVTDTHLYIILKRMVVHLLTPHKLQLLQ